MTKPLIIGIAGRKRHGKNAVGRSLVDRWGFNTIAFADPIKEAAMKWWGFSYEQVFGDDLKEIVDERWGFSPRFAMQYLGTEGVRAIHKDTWARACILTIQAAHAGEKPAIHDEHARAFRSFDKTNAGLWCVTDCRFPNEAQIIRDAGGVVIKVIRPGLAVTDTHASETSIDDIEPDHLIVNDGTLKDLERKVADIMGGVAS
jgi:hypothetical protein